jgi:hypothetical protein
VGSPWAPGVYLTGFEPDSGKSAVALGIVQPGQHYQLGDDALAALRVRQAFAELTRTI